jgi:hypothetical protein
VAATSEAVPSASSLRRKKVAVLMVLPIIRFEKAALTLCGRRSPLYGFAALPW